MAGADRSTGRILSDWAHVEQSLRVIFMTRFGSRVMRRSFGSSIPKLLGQNLVPSTILKVYMAIAIAVELWEPRFRVRRVSLPPTSNNTLNLRQGVLGLRIEGDYRPNALAGDFSISIPKVLTI